MNTSFNHIKYILSILFIFLSVFILHHICYADITPVSDRTSQVQAAIVTAAGVNTADEVTDTHLAAITELNLRGKSISELRTGDFSGLTGLTNLNLYNNELNSLPDGIFEGLTALTQLRLGSNTVDPMPITVEIEKSGDDQVQLVVPTGAPFNMVIPISITNGTFVEDITSITIPIGTLVTDRFVITRLPNTTDDIQVEIADDLPSLPVGHYGYVLNKSDGVQLQQGENIKSSPIFTDGLSTTRSVAENTESGTDIGTPIAATDANEDDTLTYSISASDATVFEIESSSGQLKTKAALDNETKASYVVVVTVSDGELTDTINVTITVTDVYERVNYLPEFDDGDSTMREILENSPIGSDIGTPIAARDDNDDDTTTYTLSGTDAATFNINSSTGQLTTTTLLDYDKRSSYAVVVTATDEYEGVDTINVTINVVHVNKVPVFREGPSTTRSVSDGTVVGGNVGDPVAAKDEDEDPLAYTLGGEDSASFDINSETGQLKTKFALDYEEKSTYMVSVSVTDGQGGSASINVTINVESPNSVPTFTDGSITLRRIAENSAKGFFIGTPVTATDEDNDTLAYTLNGPDAASFDIDSETGQLKTDSALDYETKHVYVVTVSAADRIETVSIIVIIGVIDLDDTTFAPDFVAVNARTPQVQAAIVAALPDISNADDITATHLTAITALNLQSTGITALQSGDFSGLTSLTDLNLANNLLSELPVGAFYGLTALTGLNLENNVISPIPLIVSVQKVNTTQYQAVMRSGAPFDVVLPISIGTNTMTVTIPQGSIKSDPFTVSNTGNQFVEIGTLPTLPSNHSGYILAKSFACNRTPQVATAIAAAVPGITNCDNVTDLHLATITSLNLDNMDITSLNSDDFSGLLSLTTLHLGENQLTSLPANIFADLAHLREIHLNDNQLASLPDGIFSSLTTLDVLNLSGNSTDPIPLNVALQKVGTDQFKAVVPTGAPFDIVLPINVVSGTFGDTTDIMIPTGFVESQTFTMSRTAGTRAAVTVDITTLPSLSAQHSGYALVNSGTSPLEIFERINTPPEFTDDENGTRNVTEDSDIGDNIGTPVAATDSDRTYALLKLIEGLES